MSASYVKIIEQFNNGSRIKMQSRISLDKGDLLFKEGDDSTNAYLVISGELEITKLENGDVENYGKVLPMELIGEISLINNSKRTVRLTATEPSVLAVIDKEQILERVEKSDPIIRSLVTGYARRYLNVLNNTEDKNYNLNNELTSSQIVSLIDKDSVDKISLEHDLIQAVKTKQLDVLLQPILDVATNEFVGYEALIRWDHPEQGPISPLVFIALAEETSLIDDISEYVIDFACNALNELIPLNKDLKPFISINITPNQLGNRDFITGIIGKIDLAKLPKNSLKLEISGSPSLFEDDIEDMIDLCHEHGLKVALDNFGSGESNLSLTHNFKFDTLNIDRSFTIDIQRNPRSMTLVDIIVNMGYKLNSDVMVAGIESEESLDFARELNCRYAQGYHISKPQTLDFIIEQISNGNNHKDGYTS